MKPLKLAGIGRFLRAILVVVALAGGGAQPLHAADFVKPTKNYKVKLLDYWKMASGAFDAPIDGAFLCDIPVCGQDVLFVVAGVAFPGNDSPRSKFFPDAVGQPVPVEIQQGMRTSVKEMLSTVSFQKELTEPTLRKFGPTKYMITAVSFIRGAQPLRVMMVAQTGHLSTVYQFQFFAPESTYKQNSARFEQVLESFDLLKE